MPRKPLLEIANFICRFGEVEAMGNTLYTEIVVPGLLRPIEKGKQVGRDNLFLDSEAVFLEDGYPSSEAIVGRLVKDTRLRRSQIFSPKSGSFSKTIAPCRGG